MFLDFSGLLLSLLLLGLLLSLLLLGLLLLLLRLFPLLLLLLLLLEPFPSSFNLILLPSSLVSSSSFSAYSMPSLSENSTNLQVKKMSDHYYCFLYPPLPPGPPVDGGVGDVPSLPHEVLQVLN